MQQLLIQTAAPDFAAWKSAFDAQAEALDDAGLNTLQIWKAEDGSVLVLFEVVNRARAEAFLAKETAFGRGAQTRFLQTA